ncbi:MAG: SUMF1/EgtB/PvdO family nonheme iron enzyme [Calothrix sp. MO_167.B12]|nr:SUMF1/EgtB/PvdO family nonheme iron enzyme [Calothrix sp. MO_167.B12]
MARTSPSAKNPNREDLTTRRIRVFARRYGEKTLFLAYHAAFPLTLTSNLLYCLRENFMPDCPWYAVADVLLSGLCQPVGYDLYEMEGKTRDKLLRHLCDEFGEQRLKDLANFMSQYITSRLQLQGNHRALVFGERPQWTALAYLSPDAEEAINAIKEELQRLTASTDGKERIRWAALVESYADLLSEKGFQPLLLEWARHTLDGEPIQDEEMKLAAALGVSLEPFEYDVAVISLGNSPDSELEEELQSFEFEVITVNARGEVINKEPKQAFYFVEPLGVVEGSSISNARDKETVRTEMLREELNALQEEHKTILYRLRSEGSNSTRSRLRRQLKQIEEETSRLEQELHNLQPEPAALGIEMVAIPGGTFEMGSPENEPKRYDSESPQHTVTVEPFFISKYPITQAQWRFVAQLSQVNQEIKPEPSNFKGNNRPVEQVSWYDAVEFCARLSLYTGRIYSLPSEAEWEYACRADTTTPFHFGENITGDLANYYAKATYADEPKGEYRGKTTSVGQFSPNAFGLYDMHGNVWEWCLDHWHNNYKDAPTDGSAWIEVETSDNENRFRVLRGGSWLSTPENCRCAYRLRRNPDDAFSNVGLRVVCGGRSPRTLV